MTAKNATTERRKRVLQHNWTGLANGDTLTPIQMDAMADKTVQVAGDFGSGGSITFYGSNRDADLLITDPAAAGASNGWVPLKDPQGNAMTYTAKDGEIISQVFKYLTGKVTAGTSVSLDVSVLGIGG